MSGQRVRSPEIERFRGDLFPSDSINFLRNLLNDSNRFLTNGARLCPPSNACSIVYRSRIVIDRSRFFCL